MNVISDTGDPAVIKHTVALKPSTVLKRWLLLTLYVLRMIVAELLASGKTNHCIERCTAIKKKLLAS